MENYLKELSNLTKFPNDSKIQLKLLTLLKDIYEIIKKWEKKQITSNQQSIEDSLYNLVIQNRATNDLIIRYIYYIYKYLFDKGHNSHVADFINKYSLVLHSKTASNIKGTCLWLLGKVPAKCEYKTPNMNELIKTLMKYIKSTNDIQNKIRSLGCIAKLLNLKLPFFVQIIPDILRMVFKQEKNIDNKKNILKCLYSLIFYLNPQSVEKNYQYIMDIIKDCFNDKDEKIRELSIKTYISLHNDKVFDAVIVKQKIIRKKEGEELKNFLEVLLYVGTLFRYKNELNDRVKLCYLEILRQFFILNKNFINSSESLVTKIYDLLLSDFPLDIDIREGLNIVTIQDKSISNLNEKKDFNNIINRSIEKLYRTYIKVIYNISYRKTLLMHLFKRLNESQEYMDVIENNNLKNEIPIPQPKKQKIFTLNQVNALLMSLVEFSENNCDLFELSFKNFQDLSHNINVFINTTIRSFRILMTQFLINLAYYLPSWRISILTLVLNMSSVAHAEVVSLRNTFLYFVDKNNQSEYKWSLLTKKNLELLKDICNCLALILTMFSHKSHGFPVDSSLNALTRAKNIIFGNLVDENDNPVYKTVKELSGNYNKVELHAYKESGWIIIQGLCSLDTTWLHSNSKTFFFLWKYIFSKKSCELNEYDLLKKEFKEALVTEFFVKKAALASLRKFIVSVGDNFMKTKLFKSHMSVILPNLLNFFLPHKKAQIIQFYNKHLLNAYQEAKMFLYEIFYLIPINLYSKKFKDLLYPLSDEITYNGFTDTNYEHVYGCLNQLDNFMCNQNLELDKYDKDPDLYVDNFVVEKFSFKLKNLLSKNFQFELSAINLFTEIMLDKSLNIKNRVAIFKYFLTNVTEVVMKGISTKRKEDIKNYNKVVNIALAMYLIIKNSCIRKVFIINDEESFTNSKMIFDLCYKVEDNGLLRLIASEGHSYLIQASNDIKSNLEYYLNSLEIKFNNDSNLTENDYIDTFYLISNIFRNVNFKEISKLIHNFMNFIISNFNKIEDIISNPFVPQSIYIIMNSLIENNQIDYVRKLIELYKMNFMFMNMTNSIFFKDLFVVNSLTEIRLLLILAQLDENIKENEIELFKMIINKYLKDEKFRSQKIQKNFLLLVKVLLKCKKKTLKNLIFTDSFIDFLFETKSSFYDQKLSLEIIINLIVGEYLKNNEKYNLKPKMEYLINYINNMYNKNRNFYFNHQIFIRNFRHINSSIFIYDKNNFNSNLHAISSLIDFQYFSHHNYDVLYKEFHLIKLAKFIIRVYLEKNYLNVILLLNMIKELVQNQLLLYSNEKDKNVSKNESLKSEEEQNSFQKNMTLITIRNLDFFMHLNLKKFLIKIIQNCLIESLDKVLLNSNKMIMEILGYFMSTSMVLVSCEESWYIKILGIELLDEIIQKFATVIDTRTDENNLLIQQYEVQISSCIKIIFNNNISIHSVYKGLKLIYMFITMPISTDTNYIRKVNNMVDLNDLKKNEFSIVSGGANSTSFSEKSDHILICKKLMFFCKLFLSSKTNDNVVYNTYDCVDSRISQVNVYGKNITEPYRKSLIEFFKENNKIFFNVLVKMLEDFFIVLTYEQKDAIAYQNYNYIFYGNKISYSERKLIKYGQIFIKVLAMLMNDNSSEGLKMKESEINMIINLIFYYINYFIIKYDNNNNDSNLDNLSELDKISFSLNSVNMCELIDSYLKIINNNNNIFEINKNILNNSVDLIISFLNFGIIEVSLQALVIFEAILNKFNNKIDDLYEKEEKFYFIEKISKIVYYYKTRTNFIKGDNNLFININIAILDIIIRNYNEIIENFNNVLDEYFYNILLNVVDSFVNFNVQITKIISGKLFNIILNINNEKILEIFFNEFLKHFDKLIKEFEKFFLFYFIILQFISKISDEKILIKMKEIYFNKILLENLNNQNNFLIINKSTFLSISQNFDIKIQKFILEFVVIIIEKGYLIQYLNDDLQNIILSLILKIEENEKKNILLKIILLIISENINLIDKNKISVFIFKLFSKNLDYFKSEEINNILNEEIKFSVNNLIENQMKFLKEKEEKKKKEEEEKKIKEEKLSKEREEKRKKIEENKKSNNLKPISSGLKINKLKFNKK